MTKQRRGELASVSPQGAHRFENPFRGSIAFNYDSIGVIGIIRIEPPLELSESYIEGLEHDLGGHITPRMMGRMATLYDFECDPGEMYGMPPEDRVLAATQRIIDEAGSLASLNILALEATEDWRSED